MIWRITWLFLILLVSVYVGASLQHHTNYLFISLGGWRIETTLWVAIPALLLFAFCLHSLLLLLRQIRRIPSLWHHWRIQRRMERAQTETRKGLIEFSEGHWQTAKKHLINALPDAETPLLNYLTAARAAQELGDNTLRDDYLRQAQQSTPEAKIAVELTQAQLQLATQQWEQARATLKHLQDLTPHHPYVLKLLMQLYEAVQDWAQLIILLPQLKRYDILSGNAFLKKQQYYYQEALALLIKQNQTENIHLFIKQLPKALKHDGEITACYADFLLAHQQEKMAEKYLHRSLQREVNDACLKRYSKLPASIADLNFIESLTSSNNTATLQLCLGCLCITQQLWGKARTHLEDSIQRSPSIEAYVELGRLFEKTQQNTLACEAYKQGIDLIYP